MNNQDLCTQTIFTRVKSQDKRFVHIKRERLKVVHVNICLSPYDLIRLLVERDLISDYYAEEHLAVDIWYVNRLDCRVGREMYTVGKRIEDPIAYLLLYIIIQALLDVEKGRPCDVGLWHCDLSPDSNSCTPKDHICRCNALEYLTTLPPELEKYIGLSSGTVETYIKNLCK